MTDDKFNPADSAAAITKNPVRIKDEKKPVNAAAIPKGSKVATKPVLTKTDFPPPNDPYWKENPIITEHKDGTLRPWGEDTTAINKNPNTLPKQMLPPTQPVQPNKANTPSLDLSDKAKGYSNNYYRKNN